MAVAGNEVVAHFLGAEAPDNAVRIEAAPSRSRVDGCLRATALDLSGDHDR